MRGFSSFTAAAARSALVHGRVIAHVVARIDLPRSADLGIWIGLLLQPVGDPAGSARDRETEADWRLFSTLLRFDPVYFGHFKCNLKRLIDYPNLWAYTRELYQHDGIAATVHMDHIKRHYYESHLRVNPTGIVPLGPEIDFSVPHGRG